MFNYSISHVLPDLLEDSEAGMLRLWYLGPNGHPWGITVTQQNELSDRLDPSSLGSLSFFKNNGARFLLATVPDLDSFKPLPTDEMKPHTAPFGVSSCSQWILNFSPTHTSSETPKPDRDEIYSSQTVAGPNVEMYYLDEYGDDEESSTATDIGLHVPETRNFFSPVLDRSTVKTLFEFQDNSPSRMDKSSGKPVASTQKSDTKPEMVTP